MRAGQEDTGNTHSTMCLCPFTIRSNIQAQRSQQTSQQTVNSNHTTNVVWLLGYKPDAPHTPQRLCFLSNPDFGLAGLIWQRWRSGSPWQHLGNWRSRWEALICARGTFYLRGSSKLEQRRPLTWKNQSVAPSFHSADSKVHFFFKTLESFFQCDRKRTSHSLPL